MSKAHMPHWRYVALRLSGQKIGRRALQSALTGQARKHGIPDDRLPNLTRFDWPHAIVRFRHMDADAGRNWLPDMGWAIEGDKKHAIKVETMLTSGTIKTLTDRLGILQKR